MPANSPPLPSDPPRPSASSAVKLFIRASGCALCHEALRLAPEGAEIHDVETLDGLSEFAFHGGATTVPMLVVGDTAYLAEAAVAYLIEEHKR